MKKLFQIITLASIAASFAGCAKLDNVNPNSPAEVPSNMIMNGAQKWTIDNIYDNWFSGRQCLAYSQQWTQRNYTEEDRYQIRESVNNSYFNYLYMGVANFQKIIELNSGYLRHLWRKCESDCRCKNYEGLDYVHNYRHLGRCSLFRSRAT